MTWPWRKPDNFDVDGNGGTTATANSASRNGNETVGTLNPSRDNDNAFIYEAHCRDHDGGDQGVKVRNSDVPHMNVNGASLSGVDTSDNFYEGEDEDDGSGGHAEVAVVLEARRMRGHVAAMFHSSQKITKALIGLSLFISVIIFSAGIGGIVSHNKEVTARNFAVAGGEDCKGLKKCSSPSPSGPQTASYDAALGAPKCGYGLSCDSGDLLDGRGTSSGSVEPNFPNTLNSCTDGNSDSGIYQIDESIDRIIVTRVSGGDGDLTEGDEVTITATVWCWLDGSASRIDFYYAADASNPDWTQIGNRRLCPGGGQQTMTALFTLPQGSLQAVRANFVVGSGSSGMNSCTSGSWDDTDDLVISVQPNPSIQGLVASPSKNKHDDVQGQGAIFYVEKDAAAEEMKKRLQQMSQSNEKPAVDHGFLFLAPLAKWRSEKDWKEE